MTLQEKQEKWEVEFDEMFNSEMPLTKKDIKIFISKVREETIQEERERLLKDLKWYANEFPNATVKIYIFGSTYFKDILLKQMIQESDRKSKTNKV